MIAVLIVIAIGVLVMATTGALSYRLQQRFQEVERKQFYDLLNKQRIEIQNYERLLANLARKGDNK